MKKNIKKEITFIYTDKLEHQCEEPIADEAMKRGYKINFSDDVLKKCEIGFYCQHLNFPKNSKFSCVMLHDLGQQHGEWPVMWKNEFWNDFNLGFLPSKEWADMWHNASCYDFVRPKNGCYFVGWTKSDNIEKKVFTDECEEIVAQYGINKNKKTVLYAPSWEWDGRQLEMIEACKELDVNLIIKQFPWNPKTFKFQYDICNEMAEKSKNIPNVFVLDTSINIFNAINLCDVLVSEESSTLYEAMLMDKPVVAVTDRLVPDNFPPRLPDFPYDFAVKCKKAELKETIENVLSDKSYILTIKNYRQNNFPQLGNSAKNIMDVIDEVLEGKEKSPLRIHELPLIETPIEFKKSVKKRKFLMKKVFIKLRFVDNSKILTVLYNFLRSVKHSFQKKG